SFLFGVDTSTTTMKGVNPVGSNISGGGSKISKLDFQKMGYKEQNELYHKDKALYDELQGQL
ncbi:MAG: hypothetical protein ACK5LY_06865, partial [Lachnospirales bacterium]